ncbi:MAG: iron-sulfur cluster insertion protein ErpA [Planctomycetota bacterium]
MTTIDTTAPTTGTETDAAPVILTETAAREINTIIEQQDLDRGTIHLRVGVKGGGCSGFSYVLDLTESVKDTDEQFEQHGIRVVCDPKSLLYLGGTTIDFKDEIMGRGFVFQNPNANTSCGCGSSFSV